MNAPATILTAADQKYWRCLWQMLLSAERRGLVGAFRWIAYDLGMQAETAARLRKRFSWCAFHAADFAGLPPHVPPSAGSYAWKPVIIGNAARDAEGPLLWFDSATIFRSDPRPMLEGLRRHGIYVLRGDAPIRERCEPAVMTRLGLPENCWSEPEIFAGAIAFDPARPAIRSLLEQWHGAALDRENLLPSRRTIARHMHDQAVLSCLVLGCAERGDIAIGKDQIDICAGRPITFFSSRNKIGPDTPLWADPAVRAWFRAYKAIDQFGYRLRSRRSRDGAAP